MASKNQSKKNKFDANNVEFIKTRKYCKNVSSAKINAQFRYTACTAICYTHLGLCAFFGGTMGMHQTRITASRAAYSS